MTLEEFYSNKRILITGHTGFKGAWMCQVLHRLGADIAGYSLNSEVTTPNLYSLCKCDEYVKSYYGDIRDYDALKSAFDEFRPEIVIHMAAQPLVRLSYDNPAYTFDVNIMGTVNILECIRNTTSVKSFVNITTDKVYKNLEQNIAYSEDMRLGGYDPYSNSKSCSELVTRSYKDSFFGGDEAIMKDGRRVAISTCRAGNVIGGGDFAGDRLIPDCVRAALNRDKIIIRNPYSVRPYQHVLEPVTAYLLIAMRQYEDMSLNGSYNIDPNTEDIWNSGRIADAFINEWNKLDKTNLEWIHIGDDGPHEANLLMLDNTLVKNVFGISPRWNVEQAIAKIVEWTVCYKDNPADVINITTKQLEEYIDEVR